jgi:hypothetical protein
MRNEELQKLEDVISENKLATNNLGDLPPVLEQCPVDSNSTVAAVGVAICQSLGNAMSMLQHTSGKWRQ